MIVYNSHETRTLLRLRGSVLVEAMKWAVSAGLAALILKYLQNHYMPKGFLGELEISPAAYSGFSFTLGFVIVFRTSQCYNRFWTCATHVNAMRAEWYEAASGLTTFVTMSTRPVEEQDIFCHKVIRYFSLLHSLSLQVLADGDAFPVIDLQSLPEEHLKFVVDAGSDAEGPTARVELVYQWIQALIVQSMASGLLNVPAPILTRVLQQMTTGMVNFNSVLDIISIPFPFPYAQVTFILLTVYVCFIPIVMCLLVEAAWIAFFASFLSVLCLISVDLVSTEIENPFGDDANDLPCHEFTNKMNRALLNLLHPAASDPPELCQCAKLTYQELAEACETFTVCDMGGHVFHGGKLKPKTEASEAKPIPVAKERKPKEPPKADSSSPSGGTQPPSGGEIVLNVGPDSLAGQQMSPASGGQESQGYAQNLIVQQSMMLGEFMQSNGAMLERMDRTFSALEALTTALTDQVPGLSEMQMRLLLQSRAALPMDVASLSSPSNAIAGEEIPPCLSWSSLLSLPASRPGIGLASSVPGGSPSPPQPIAQSPISQVVVVQPRAS